jgi:hypothetical protein
VARTPGVDRERRDLPGELALFKAVADRLVDDIRNPRPLPPSQKKTGGRTTTLDQLSAIETLCDPDGGISAWAVLIGLDPDLLREKLMVLAGLCDATTRLGAYDFLPGEADELSG